MSNAPSVLFNKTISTLIETMQTAWNNSDLELMRELLEEEIVIYVEPVIVSKIIILPEKISGRDNVIDYIVKIRKKLPLRYTAEYDKSATSKKIKYRKYFYEIRAWATFESTISEHGKFKEFKIGNYKNIRSKKLTSFYIFRNILLFKLKSLFRKRSE